ncbi:hypothetical protein [Microbacterium lacticum]|uniref:hypothetical protein n=1 Tax=Microbacterium lacticum TaxID=33885 RepID=UPI0028D0D398|nr:hypothetical protein [Microbacterium lacticum]
MTTATAQPLPHVGITLNLTRDAKACAMCGVAVEHPVDRVDVNVGVRWHRLPGGNASDRAPRSLVVTFSRCEACAVRRQHAEALVELYPRVAAAQGARDVAALRFEAVLAVGDLLRAPISLDGAVSGNVSAVASARELALLLERVLAPALALPFSRDAEARQGIAGASPWAHVGPELRTAARDGLAAWLRARIAKPSSPVALPVPEGAEVLGCALCGVGTATAWRRFNVNPRPLGGSTRARALAAVACPVCADAIDRYGVGRTALAAALLAHAGVRRLGGVDDLEADLLAFAALPIGTPPNATPFEGADFDALRRDAARLGVTA